MEISVHVVDGCFSKDGMLYASINGQGVIRIWNTESSDLKQEFTPNLHISGLCTAFTWIFLKNSIKSKENNIQTPYLVLGTSTGGIALYSYTLGKIDRIFKVEGHNGNINGITYDMENRLYTCGDDGQILIWDIYKGSVLHAWSTGSEKLYNICYLPYSQTVAVSSRKIQIYGAKEKELLQTFTGHSSDITVMSNFVLSNGAEYIITASRSERIACVWKIGKKGLNNAAICTFVMEDVVHCITAFVNTQDLVQVTTVTRCGVMQVFIIPSSGLKKDKSMKPKLTIKIVSDHDEIIEPIAAVAVRAEPNNTTTELCFGYGSNNCLLFERIKPNLTDKMEILIRTSTKNIYKKGAHSNQNNTLKTQQPNVNVEEVDYKHSLIMSKKKLNPIEMPMECRLQNLNQNELRGVVKTQSKVQLLLQALHSKDQTLLRSVLCTDDLKIIQLTCQKLPVRYVGTLVNELSLIMQLKRSNVVYSLKWLKILAQTHSSQLMALGADDLLSKFGICVGIIEHRANCLKELSKLNGRVQLLVNQIKQNIDDDCLRNENIVVYDDSDSSSSDLDENNSTSTSNSDWEEGETDEQENMEEDNNTIDF